MFDAKTAAAGAIFGIGGAAPAVVADALPLAIVIAILAQVAGWALLWGRIGAKVDAVLARLDDQSRRQERHERDDREFHEGMARRVGELEGDLKVAKALVARPTM